MKFKIQGEQEVDENNSTYSLIEILGKKAIEKLIDNKIDEFTDKSLKPLFKENEELRQKILNLEETISIKRKEPLKFDEEELLIKRKEILKLKGKKDENK
jgi:hypothetical protein